MVIEKISICNCKNCKEKENKLSGVVDKLNYEECLLLLETDSSNNIFTQLIYNKCLDLNPKAFKELIIKNKKSSDKVISKISEFLDGMGFTKILNKE